jgi:hypothetical protein
MSDYHNIHWVEFYPKSHFSALVFVAVNCITFDAISCLTGSDTDLFFATNCCFICHVTVHRAKSCPQRSLGMLFCKCLDDPHCEFHPLLLSVFYGWCTGWDAHCPGLTVARKQESDWKNESERWATAPTNSTSGWDVDDLAWKASNEKLVTTLFAIGHGWPNCHWPSVEEGVEVSVEVRSNLEDSVEKRSICRCFHTCTDLSSQLDQPFMIQLHWYFLWKLCMLLSLSLT